MHVIRLRGPWESTVASRFSVAAEGPTVVVGSEPGVPFAAQSGVALAPAEGFRGRWTMTRRFHAPSGLRPHDRVQLTIDLPGALGEAQLNGAVLGEFDLRRSGAPPASFEIGPLLRTANVLALLLEHPWLGDLAAGRVPGPAPVWEDVRLEIVETRAD